MNVGDAVRFDVKGYSGIFEVKGFSEDGQHVLLTNGKTWPRAVLVLASEWKDKSQALPVIEKGIPVPDPKPDKRLGVNRGRLTSKWPGFLRSLEPGDSFVLSYPDASTLKAHARTLGIELRWVPVDKGLGAMFKERFWRV